jgi:hypothetical protein
MRLQARAWLLLMLLLAFAGGASAAVSAQVDRERIALSESIELTIRVAGSMRAAEPDLAPLERHFEVLGSTRNSSFTMSNGRSESSTTWQVTLMARHAGELTIPAIEVGGERTQPIAIRVSEDPAPASAAAREVQLQVETDAAEVHVQQQLLLTVRLLHAVDFQRGATLDAPEIPDAVVRELGENSYEKLIDDRRYGVFERRYAVFPQRSGELVVPALGFQAALGGGGWFDRSGGRGRMLRLRSEEKRIRVLPPEAGATPWLPARVLTVIETWDRSPQELRVGDSATRTVTITATGLTGAQLPPLPAPAVEGLRFYPDQPRIEDAQDAEGITGTRIESSAVIPSRAGDIEFPEIRVRWWDTGKQRFEEAVVPRRSIRVLPGANAAPAPAPLAGAQPGASAAAPAAAAGSATIAAPAQQNPPPSAPPWPWIIATLLLALSTAFSSWQWRRLALATPPSAAEPASWSADTAREAQLFATLAAACRANDASQVQALLPRWGRAAFPHAAIHSASDLGATAQDEELGAHIERLLASRYGANAAPCELGALLGRLEAARAAALEQRKRGTREDALPPLYAAPHAQNGEQGHPGDSRSRVATESVVNPKKTR